MNVNHELSRKWSPLPLDEVAAQLRGAPFPWWIAGGWAIDLFAGHKTREHADVEVAVLCRDLTAFREWFASWDLWYVPIPGGLRSWELSEELAHPVHEIWGRQRPDTPWQMEILLENTTASGDWSYRRDPRISLPIASFGIDLDGLPVVRPEIALLYKSKAPRAHDEADLQVTAPLLDARSCRWLADALETCGSSRAWVPQLRAQHE